MAVLECATAEDRELAMVAAEDATGGRALVSGCPAVKRHVLIVLPKRIARDDAAVRAMLSPLTEGTGAAVGVSNTMPYWSLAFLYTTARGALAAARGAEDRIVVAAGGTTLSGELPQHLYAAWAAAVRAPGTPYPGWSAGHGPRHRRCRSGGHHDCRPAAELGTHHGPYLHGDRHRCHGP